MDGVIVVLPRQTLDIPIPTPSNLLKLRRTVLQVYFAELGASQSQYWELPVSIWLSDTSTIVVEMRHQEKANLLTTIDYR